VFRDTIHAILDGPTYRIMEENGRAAIAREHVRRGGKILRSPKARQKWKEHTPDANESNQRKRDHNNHKLKIKWPPLTFGYQ